MVGAYTALVTELCQLRFENFYGSVFDLGVNQQLLWTGSHGYLLYETPDLLTTGIHSFLEIHSTYVAFLVAPLYAALPYPGTLFAIESAAVASAVFPMYLIARQRGVAPSFIFPLLVVFLSSFAILGALLFDFHWEAFLPTELLWFYFLVRRRSYLFATLPMVFGFATLEIFPVLVGGVVLLCLSEKWYEIGSRPRALIRDRDVRMQLVFALAAGVAYGSYLLLEHWVIPSLVGTSGVTGVYTGPNPSYTFLANPGSLGVSTVYWLLLLASFGFIPVLSPKSMLPTLPWFVESVVLQPIYSSGFGNQYALIAVSTLAIAYVEGFARLNRPTADSTRALLVRYGLMFSAAVSNGVAFGSSGTLLGARSAGLLLVTIVLPTLWVLLVPILLLAAALSVLFLLRISGRRPVRESLGAKTNNPVFLTLVAALCSTFLFDFLCLLLPYPAVLAPSYVWLTLAVPPLCVLVLLLMNPVKRGAGSREATPLHSSRRLSNLGLRRSLWVSSAALLVGFNLAMSPINPANFETPRWPGYNVGFSSNPVWNDMGWIVGQIPADSVVLAANDLFPFEANNPNAWPALNLCINDTCPPPHSPFSSSNLPDFVLTDSPQWVMLPLFVQDAMLNTSAYGLVAEIYSTNSEVGSVYLFERGYQGVPLYRFASSLTPPYFGSASNLTLGPSGSVVRENQSKFGNVIESRENRSVPGNESLVWQGSTVYPLAGLYVVTYNLTGTSPYASSRPNTPALQLDLVPPHDEPSPAYFSANITAGGLYSSGWSQYRFLVPFEGAFQQFETQGYLYYTMGQPNANITLNYVEVAPY